MERNIVIKLKHLLNEGLNKSDITYAMKMAFDSVPGNWHKALKSVNIYGKEIGLVMSSYMGPGKVLQKIVDEFNRSMGTRFKIDKDSFEKGYHTSIRLMEGKLNEASIRGLEDLKDGYYGIADELADMKAHIEAVRNNPDGMDWETDKLGKGGFRKEIILFQKMERLFNTSKLGKVL